METVITGRIKIILSRSISSLRKELLESALTNSDLLEKKIYIQDGENKYMHA